MRKHDGDEAALLGDGGIVPAEEESNTNYCDAIHASLVNHNIHHNVKKQMDQNWPDCKSDLIL